MKKILIISTCGLGFGGVTSVILNYARHIPGEQLSLEFVSADEIPPELQETFSAIGKLHILDCRQRDLKAYIKNLYCLLRENRYDAVHIHGNSGTMVIEAFLAKCCGVSNVMVHGHNTSCDHPALNRVMVPFMKGLADQYLSCSQAAGEWLYGRSRFTVLKNAIDLERFRYSPEKRRACRAELRLEDAIVVGHIGYFTEQKNHEFLIDLFEKAYEKEPRLHLILVSEGRNLERIRKKVGWLGLEKAVSFLGSREDADRLYQAMDLFVLPSRWEGLPMVMLEAQAAGLPMVVSDRITRDAGCTDRVRFQALEDGPVRWADTVLNLVRLPDDREVYSCRCEEQLRAHGFDILQEAENLEKLYLK